jgi:hypothetical protein
MENIVKDKHGWKRWNFKPNSCYLTLKWKKVNVRNVKHDSDNNAKNMFECANIICHFEDDPIFIDELSNF